jgi:hypothetical protein
MTYAHPKGHKPRPATPRCVLRLAGPRAGSQQGPLFNPSALQSAAGSPSVVVVDQLRDHTGKKAKYWLILKEIIRAAPCFFLRVLAWY